MNSLHDYRWPAEWERHDATWLAWPVNPNTWPGIFEGIPAAYAEFVAAIACFEPVRILAGGAGVADAARPLIDAACSRQGSRYVPELFDIPVNDSWCRDHGPIFLTGRRNTPAAGQSVIIDWNYNAWGGKYPPWDLDELTARRIGDFLDVRCVRPNLILEGGAIEGNGAGTILTTESCLLNPNRNAGATRGFMEATLKQWLQAENIVWIPGHGIIGDDTDGHIDDLTRFVNSDTVVTIVEENKGDENYEILQDNLKELKTLRLESGKPLNIIELPMPSTVVYEDQRLPASYANFYIANKYVVVPTFRDKNDDKALAILQDCFPDRKVIGLDSTDIIWGLGSFHCLSQQEPAV